MLVDLKYYVSLFSMLVLLSCGTNTTNQPKSKETGERVDTTNATIVENPLDQYWKKYTFSVNEVQQYPAEIEQSLVDYLAEFPNYSFEEVDASLKRLIHKTGANPEYFSFVKEKLSLYLYDPNSPMRNDIYYEHVLNAYLLSDEITELDKQREQLILDLVKKNQVGSTAANFEFTDNSNRKHQMKDFIADYKMLVFYDPTCIHCNEVINEMMKSDVLLKAIESKHLQVLAIDPIGNYQEWIKYHPKLPRNWTNGIDKSTVLTIASLYNIRAFPTIYLLDKDNYVVLKDSYFPIVENFVRAKSEN